MKSRACDSGISDPTVRLLRAVDNLAAMLLERCEPRTGQARCWSLTRVMKAEIGFHGNCTFGSVIPCRVNDACGCRSKVPILGDDF